MSAGGLLLFAATSSLPVAYAGTILYGAGFSMFFSSSLALVQRLAGEEKRGRVTSVFAVLQEGSALVVAAAVVGLGDLVVVRPSIVASAVLLGATGILGLAALSHGATRGPARLEPERGRVDA